MANFLKGSANAQTSYGRVLTSWIYKPKKSKQFLFYILGLVAALGVFAAMYGEQFLPWIKKIPDTFIYILFLAAGPLLNLFRSAGKTQEWTLYERGYSVRYTGEGKTSGEEKHESWEEYKSCTYDSESVTLIPVQPYKRKVKMRAAVNAMEIYSICRERISIAQAKVLHRPTRMPSTPNTPEHRRLARLEKEYSKRVFKNAKW